jgi:(p)ppGpp synthase/HD superfamily hydrolase
MGVLSSPLSPLLATALALARQWCAGQTIDGAPALRHAVQVTRVLAVHVPNISEHLLAAALVHDSPDFAPVGLDLDAVLNRRLSPGVTSIVRGLQAEHVALDGAGVPSVPTEDLEVLLVSAADKVVALNSMLTRAGTATEPDEFWQARHAFIALLGYFRAFADAGQPSLPSLLAVELRRLVREAEASTLAYR